jgi:hypothetical protein
MHDDVDFAHTKGAEHNRILKARKIARWLWDRSLSFSDVLAADDARRRAWARAAMVTPPSTMDTWQAVNAALVAMEQFAEDNPGHPATQRPHADERGTWLGVLEEPAPAPAPAPAEPTGVGDWFRDTPESRAMLEEERAALAKSEAEYAAKEVIYPRGWAELVALGPIPRHDAKCATCRGPAVGYARVNDREEWRCANHPPQPGEWGAALNWTPRGPVCGCAPNRCYCGRGPHFKLGGTGFRLSDSSLLDERAAAKGKNRAPVHVRQAAIAAEEARKATRK